MCHMFYFIIFNFNLFLLWQWNDISYLYVWHRWQIKNNKVRCWLRTETAFWVGIYTVYTGSLWLADTLFICSQETGSRFHDDAQVYPISMTSTGCLKDYMYIWFLKHDKQQRIERTAFSANRLTCVYPPKEKCLFMIAPVCTGFRIFSSAPDFSIDCYDD